jgi:hypothetical protein
MAERGLSPFRAIIFFKKETVKKDLPLGIQVAARLP